MKEVADIYRLLKKYQESINMYAAVNKKVSQYYYGEYEKCSGKKINR